MLRLSRVARQFDLSFQNRLLKQITGAGQVCLSSNSATLDKIFPRTPDFPSRHIGPREHEQSEMLELLGFRVSS